MNAIIDVCKMSLNITFELMMTPNDESNIRNEFYIRLE